MDELTYITQKIKNLETYLDDGKRQFDARWRRRARKLQARRWKLLNKNYEGEKYVSRKI